MTAAKIPDLDYGVLFRDEPDTDILESSEQVRRLGYAVLDSGYSAEEIQTIQRDFELTASTYAEKYGVEKLRKIDELHTIRAPLVSGSPAFVELATNENLMRTLQQLILGRFILNQQNGIINPPNERYNQGAWHRDLPYQHFVSSDPIAINALYCVDDFTRDNGATFVLPASHKAKNFPSAHYVEKNAVQLEASAGQYVLLDCMLFHSGGYNQTNQVRRAVNHVYTIPFFKQQIKLPGLLDKEEFTTEQQSLFGFDVQEPTSIEQYLGNRRPS